MATVMTWEAFEDLHLYSVRQVAEATGLTRDQVYYLEGTGALKRAKFRGSAERIFFFGAAIKAAMREAMGEYAQHSIDPTEGPSSQQGSREAEAEGRPATDAGRAMAEPREVDAR